MRSNNILISWNLFLQTWAKLVETKVENQVNSAKGSIFQIFQNFASNNGLGGEGSFHWNIDFLFCLNSFVQSCK